MKSVTSNAGIEPNSFPKLTTVMAIDICEFSALMEQSDEQAIKAVKTLQTLISETAKEHNGRLFHSAGDGFLSEFRTTKEAFSAARAILEKRRSYQIRIGIHVGDVTVQPDGDLLGHTVNVAARLQQTAKPDTIMLSAQSFNLVSEPDKRLVGDERQISLKNINENYAVRELSRRHILDDKLKHKSRSWIKAAVVSMLLFVCGWLAIDKFGSYQDDSERQAILAQALDKYNQKNKLDRRYLSHLLHNLKQSKTPISELTITLIESNKISEAIASLENSLENIDVNDPRYLKILHYIGALAYQTDPDKSKRTYEIILGLNKDDIHALIRLGRAHDFIGETNQALKLYEQAYQAAEDTDTRFWLQLDIGYNHLIMGKNETALGIYETMYAEIGEKIEEDSQLASKVFTDLGVAYERVGNYPEAISLTLKALQTQKKNGHFRDLARSHTLMGYLLLNDTSPSKDDKTSQLDQAAWHYSEQMKIDKQMNNLRGISLANNSLGGIYMMKGDPALAREHYNYALLNAMPPQEMLIYLNLAELEKQEGSKEAACNHLKKAKVAYTKLGANIGPKTRKRILSLKCDFSFSFTR